METLRATLFIDTPPEVRWNGETMEVTVQSGDIRFTRIMTRHAAVGLLAGLQRELSREPGADIQELRRQLCGK